MISFLSPTLQVIIANHPSLPTGSYLRCLLNHWRKLCFTTILPCFQTNWGDGEKRPQQNSLNENTILELDLFHRRQGKWSETLCVQTFLILYKDPLVCPGHTELEEMEREKILDALDSSLLPLKESLKGNSGTPSPNHS